MKKILWISKNVLTDEQIKKMNLNTNKDEDIEIINIRHNLVTTYEIEDYIKTSDIIAIDAMVGLQQQFLKLAGDKPVIVPVYDWVLHPERSGCNTIDSNFVKWKKLIKIEVDTEDYIPQ